MMLTAAFFGALGSWATGVPVLGILCAVLATMVLAAVQALLSINLRANQLVVGIGFNILALGATTLRSEEHTSELQSLMRISYAVFCLKKKKHANSTTDYHHHQQNT